MAPFDFDRYTRRFVLAGLTGGSLSALLGRAEAAAKKPSKRKRCKQKKRKWCAGRCCPKKHRCEHGTCVRSCVDPCFLGDGNCLGGGGCFCSTSVTGASARLKYPENPYCLANSCSATNPCPSGQICGTCNCGASGCNFRCFDPCPAG